MEQDRRIPKERQLLKLPKLNRIQQKLRPSQLWYPCSYRISNQWGRTSWHPNAPNPKLRLSGSISPSEWTLPLTSWQLQTKDVVSSCCWLVDHLKILAKPINVLADFEVSWWHRRIYSCCSRRTRSFIKPCRFHNQERARLNQRYQHLKRWSYGWRRRYARINQRCRRTYESYLRPYVEVWSFRLL